MNFEQTPASVEIDRYFAMFLTFAIKLTHLRRPKLLIRVMFFKDVMFRCYLHVFHFKDLTTINTL